MWERDDSSDFFVENTGWGRIYNSFIQWCEEIDFFRVFTENLSIVAVSRPFYTPKISLSYPTVVCASKYSKNHGNGTNADVTKIEFAKKTIKLF